MAIPKAKVMAKPRTGPDVFKNDHSKGFIRTNAVIKVATLASRMEFQALPKEISKASGIGRFKRSSLNLSKIKILLSTAIPTESKNPAIPGKVKTTGISLYRARVKTPKMRKVMYFQKVNTQTDYGLLFAEACFCKNIPTLLSGLNMYQGVKGTITIEDLKALIEGNQDYVKYEHGKRETTKTHFLDIMGYGFGHQMRYVLGYIILEKYGIMKYVLSEEDLIRKFMEDNVNPMEYFKKRLR